MNIKEKIYYSSPKIIQEYLIYIKSVNQQYKYKYKPDADLVSIEGDSLRKSDLLITNEINKMLDYASKNVPFYRKQIALAGLEPHDVNIHNYKRIFPIITKEDIKSNPIEFVSDISSHSVNTIHTSGTTGQPLAIKTNKDDRAKNYYFFNSLLAKYGVLTGDKSITIAGKKLSIGKGLDSISRLDRYSNTMYLSNYDLSESNIDHYIDIIKKFDPVYIDTYPFPIVTLAKRIIALGAEDVAPSIKLILTSSEALDSESRKILITAFHCTVLDQYGSAEMASFGYSDDGIKFIFPGLYSQLEFPKTECGSYDIIATSLVNRGMPIIRYATGDRVKEVFENGIAGGLTGRVLGRTEDSLILPDGNVITQFNPISGVSHVKSAQIFQDKHGNITIEVIPDEGFTSVEVKRIYEVSKAKLGKDLSININYVDKHKLTANGKFKFINSEFSSS